MTGDASLLDPHQSWVLIPLRALIQILARVVVSSRTGAACGSRSEASLEVMVLCDY